MDLKINGKRALVCASSKGLGRGCALALAQAGCAVTLVARGQDALDTAVAEIKAATGARVDGVVADVTNQEGRIKVLTHLPDPDILVTNAGGPPTGDFRTFSHEDWIKALDANMLTPIALIKATIDAMQARKWGRIINITSAAVKAPIDVLALSNGARTGLTGFVAGLARAVAKDGITINNLLPGLFETDRGLAVIAAQATAQGVSQAEAKKVRESSIPAGRLGKPEEFGAMCAFLCSDLAGYVTGQNILLDGGAYPGTF